MPRTACKVGLLIEYRKNSLTGIYQGRDINRKGTISEAEASAEAKDQFTVNVLSKNPPPSPCGQNDSGVLHSS
jgi:hypothetical protein